MYSLTHIFKSKRSKRLYQVVSLSRTGTFNKMSTLISILNVELSFKKPILRKMECSKKISLIRNGPVAKSFGRL